MLKKLVNALVHIVMLAVVCAVAAYWVIKIVTPQPTSAPPPLAAPPPRDPDPTLAARMFGLVQVAQAVVSNIQVTGVFAAGSDSAAVLTVDGKPARTYVIGQEVAPGTTLVEVRSDAAVVESGGGRQELRVPPRPVTPMIAGTSPAPAYSLQGNTLSAPGGSSTGAPLMPRPPAAGAQAVQPVQPIPAAPPPTDPGVAMPAKPPQQ